MFGIVIGLIIFCCKHFFAGAPAEAAFLSATGFYYVWNWIFGGIYAFILLLRLLGINIGSLASNKLGILGKAGVAAASLVLGVLGLINAGLWILGSWLLNTSGQPTQDFDQFDKTKLIVGTIVIFVAWAWSKATAAMRAKSSD